jgi:Pyruvate/2-oxoacid:ferredoxin oxidoreductase delta subunit
VCACGRPPGRTSTARSTGRQRRSLGADALLVSIGQDADLDALAGGSAGTGAPAQRRRRWPDRLGGWWAGGDVASHDRHVSAAIGMGRRAALAIHRHLSGETAAAAAAEPVVSAAAIATWYHDPAPRADAGRLPVAQRLAGDAEVQCGLDTAAAVAEASRCFSCGLCVSCDQCVTWCPDLAVWRDDDGYHIDADHCKGCGLCVRECPSGAMLLEEEQA